MNHLIGAKEDCSDVIGIYPMLSNETCNFWVFDLTNMKLIINWMMMQIQAMTGWKR